MTRFWKHFPGRTALAVLALAAAFGPHVAHSETDSLNGKAFIAAEGDPGKPAKLENVLTFSDDKFHSKACDQWSYGKGEVKAFREGDAIRFETETRSDKYGRQVWKGTVKGDTIEGTKTVYAKSSFFRPNPEPSEGWFKGTLRPN